MPCFWAAAAASAAVASFTDVRRRKIPNWLVLVTLAAGVGGRAFNHTMPVAGWGCLFGAGTFLFYLFGLWAPGDVKFAAALGSLTGPSGVVATVFFALVFFFFYAFWFLILRGDLRENLKREWRVLCLYGSTLLFLMSGLRFQKVRELSGEVKSCQAGFVQVPFAAFLLLGVLAAGVAAGVWR